MAAGSNGGCAVGPHERVYNLPGVAVYLPEQSKRLAPASELSWHCTAPPPPTPQLRVPSSSVRLLLAPERASALSLREGIGTLS